MLEKLNRTPSRVESAAALYDWDELVQEDRVHRLIYTDPAIFQAEIFSRAGKIVVEAVSRGIESGEDEAAIAVHARGRGQRQFLARKRVAIRFFTGNTDELPARIKRPRVIGTLKRPRVARSLPAYLSAAMRTGIQEHANDLVVAAHQYHRPTGNGPRSIVAGVRNLGFVPDVNPAPAEKARALLLKAFRIDERAPIHAEQSRCLIVNYVRGVGFFHDESPRDTASVCMRSSSNVRALAIGQLSMVA